MNGDRSRPHLAPLEPSAPYPTQYTESVPNVHRAALYERVFFGLPAYGRVMVVMAILGGGTGGIAASVRLWAGFQPAATAEQENGKLGKRIDVLRNDLTEHIQAERTTELAPAVKKAIVKEVADAMEEATPAKRKPKRRAPPATPPSDIDERP